MAVDKRIVFGVVALTLAVGVALGPAKAVSLKSLLAKKEPLAFAEVSLATATQAEMQTALKSAIRAAISEELGAMIDEEIKQSDLFSSVKGVAAGALGDMMASLKQSMGETCQRFADLAQSKLDSVDDKLKAIAGEDDSESESPVGNGAQDGATANNASNESQSGAEKEANVSTLQTTPALSADRVAFLEVELREKHKGLFDSLKKVARKSFKKIKKVGGYIKKGVKSIWNTIKPAVANGVRSAVARMKGQVPSLIGRACDSAEEKLERLESKVVPDSEEVEQVSEDATTV